MSISWVGRAAPLTLLLAPTLLSATHGDGVADSVGRSAQQPREWTVSAVPEVSIGELDGAPEYTLFRVRDALRLPDGRLVVANGGTSEVRYYDRAGRHLHTAGRKGRGPGEFESLMQIVRLRADTIVAFDYGRSARVYLDGSGRHVRTDVTDRARLVRGENGPIPSLELLPTAGLLVRHHERVPMVPGVHRPALRLATVGSDGARVDTLGTFAGSENYRPRSDPRNSVARPFGRTTLVAASAQHVFVGDNDGNRIHVFSHTGQPVRTIVHPAPVRRVGAADRKAALERMREPLRARNALTPERERLIRELELPETMPMFAALHADVQGNLWVQEYGPRDVPARWAIYDVSGRRLASATTPVGLRVLEVGTDYVLGVSTDDEGVERLHQFKLRR